MRINIGTISPVKVRAVKDVIADYLFLNKAKVSSFKVGSGVSDQPMSLEETILGAKNRAKNSFDNCDLSFGIESGLMAIPETKTGFMNASVCAIFDGKNFHLGIASGYEYPKKVTELMLKKGLEASHAMKEAGLTEKEKIGYAEGSVGFLTKGRINSEEYYRHAIINALIHLENKELFC